MKAAIYVRYSSDSQRDSMVKRTGEMLCEICDKRPATRTLPRGPVFPGHDSGYFCVCNECERILYAGGERDAR
jgi:hypothetical protein